MDNRSLEDADLIEKARRGDSAAYSVLVARYQEAAFRTAYLIAGGTGDAEDATQEAFVKAHAALGRFRSDASFRAWLLSIVANEAKNRVRSHGRRASLHQRTGQEGMHEEPAPSPEGAVLKSEERDRVIRALNDLGSEDRLVLVQRYFLDLTEKEMADALGCAPGTVKSRLSRALAKVRTKMVEGSAGA